MRTALLICQKDLKARVRDRSVLLVGLVVPLALAFIFNAVFSGAAGGNKAVSLGVVDIDGGAAAQTFVRHVLGDVAKGGFITVHPEPNEAVARSLVAKGKLNAAVVIPAGFTTAVDTVQATSLAVIGNADTPISTEIARSIAEGYAADLNRVRLAVNTVAASGQVSASTNELVGRAIQTDAPLAVRDVSTASKQLNNKSFYAAGMAVFFVFLTVGFGVTGLLEERTDGTLSRLCAAPIARTAILAGKMLTSLILGVASMAVLVVATSLLFGASWGNPLGVAVLVVAAVLAALAIMALIATIAKTAEEAGNWQSLVAVVLGLLGGSFFPVAQGPGILGALSLATPQAWFLRGLGDLRAGNLNVIWAPAVAMLAFAVVAGGLAIARMPKTVAV